MENKLLKVTRLKRNMTEYRVPTSIMKMISLYSSEEKSEDMLLYVSKLDWSRLLELEIEHIFDDIDTLDEYIRVFSKAFDSLDNEHNLHHLEDDIVEDYEIFGEIVEALKKQKKKEGKRKLCRVCGVKSKSKCSECFTYYCGREHQKQDWENHKKVCIKCY